MTDNCAAARRRGWTAVAHLDTDRTITALARFTRADAQQQPESPMPNT
ncbi:hypothetical protein ACFO9E_05525 [Streptomyces maoxianensis]|uniref:Uncharacterized protein n=1 Tax=Streptomyces maoxianensis TaxID=1459942 RepID=A0ABV9G2J3_9ACTN